MVTRVFGWHVRHRTEQMFAPSIARRHTNRTERAELLDRSESLGADTAVRTRSHRSRQGSNLAPAKHQTRRFRGRSCDRDVAPLCRCEGMTKSGARLTGVRRSRRTNQGGEGGDTKRRRRWRVAVEHALSGDVVNTVWLKAMWMPRNSDPSSPANSFVLSSVGGHWCP